MPTVCARNRALKIQQRGHVRESGGDPGFLARKVYSSCGRTKAQYMYYLPRPKALNEILGLGMPYAHRTCVCNEFISLRNRVLAPSEQVTQSGKGKIRRLMQMSRKIGENLSGVKLSRRQFVQSVPDSSKRKLYERAEVNLDRYGLDLLAEAFKLFVKIEPIDEILKGSTDPRAIQAGSPEYNIEFGRYYKPLEHQLITMNFNKLFPWAPATRLIAKGLNNVQRGRLLRKKWTRFKNPVAIDIDASRFDMHVSREWLKVERECYLAAFNYDHYLKLLFKVQLMARGKTSGGIKYKANGGRMSGVQNTGGGNSLICTLLVLSYFERKGVDFEFVCDGDDGVIFMDVKDLASMEGFSAHCAHLGFKMTIGQPVMFFDQVQFCQSQPIEVVHDKWVMVRNAKRALSRFGMSNTSMATPTEALQTLWAIGSCELALHAGIPVMQEYALWCLRNGTKCSDRKFKMMQRKLSHNYWSLPKRGKPMPVTTRARVSFSNAFGISISEQLLLEKAFRNSDFGISSVRYISEPVDTGAGTVHTYPEEIYKLR